MRSRPSAGAHDVTSSCYDVRIRLPFFYTDASSSVGVLGSNLAGTGCPAKDASSMHTAACLSLDSFTTIFGPHILGRLALILHGEAYRRSAEARRVKSRPEHTGVSDNSEASAPAHDQTNHKAANIGSEDGAYFFIFQGNHTRRVLSAPATRSLQQPGACIQEANRPNATRPQSKHSSPPERRSVSANMCKRSHSAGVPGCQTAANHAQNTESSSQGMAKALRLPEFLRQSKLHDSDKRSRSAKLMELMSSHVQGPIAADASQSALITHEIRLEVATAWGVPALYGIKNMEAEGKENTGAFVDCLTQCIHVCDCAHSHNRPFHSAVDVEVEVLDKQSRLLHSLAVSIPNSCSQCRVHIVADDSSLHQHVQGVHHGCGEPALLLSGPRDLWAAWPVQTRMTQPRQLIQYSSDQTQPRAGVRPASAACVSRVMADSHPVLGCKRPSTATMLPR